MAFLIRSRLTFPESAAKLMICYSTFFQVSSFQSTTAITFFLTVSDPGAFSKLMVFGKFRPQHTILLLVATDDRVFILQVAQQHWPRVSELRDLRTRRVKEARDATEAADKYLDAFLECITSAKKDEMTKSNPALPR